MREKLAASQKLETISGRHEQFPEAGISRPSCPLTTSHFDSPQSGDQATTPEQVGLLRLSRTEADLIRQTTMVRAEAHHGSCLNSKWSISSFVWRGLTPHVGHRAMTTPRVCRRRATRGRPRSSDHSQTVGSPCCAVSFPRDLTGVHRTPPATLRATRFPHRMSTTEQSLNNPPPNTLYRRHRARATGTKNQRDTRPALSC